MKICPVCFIKSYYSLSSFLACRHGFLIPTSYRHQVASVTKFPINLLVSNLGVIMFLVKFFALIKVDHLHSCCFLTLVLDDSIQSVDLRVELGLTSSVGCALTAMLGGQ